MGDDYSLVARGLSIECDLKLLTASTVTAIHDSMISAYGGTTGVRDEGLLQSAVSRQLQTISYGSDGVFDVAASLAYGVASNHAFLDGNKRTAFGSFIAFLDANNICLKYDPVEAHQVFLGLAAGEVSEAELSAWAESVFDKFSLYSFEAKLIASPKPRI